MPESGITSAFFPCSEAHRLIFQLMFRMDQGLSSSSLLVHFFLLVCVLPWWINGKESACQCRRHGFDPWIGKISWRRKWQAAVVFLPRKSHRQKSLVGYMVTKELNMTQQLSNNNVWWNLNQTQVILPLVYVIS